MKKNIIISLFLLFSFLFSINYVLGAEPTQNYVKIYLNPYYRASMVSGTNYDYNLSITPPDGISNVINAMITFQVYYAPTVTYTLLVNGQACNNPSFIISTTYAGASMGYISFDCSNVIKKSGAYTARLSANKNSGAIYGWIDLTYMNNPIGDLTIHGTEYTSDQNVKVWLQLLNGSTDYVNAGVCFVEIYSPDNQVYVQKTVMDNMNMNGIYYYDLVAPLIEGVYPVVAECYYEASETAVFSTSINVTTGNGANTFITDDFECNGLNCGTGWTGNWIVSDAKVKVVAGGIGSYQLRFEEHDRWGYRVFDDTFYSGGAVTLSFYAGASSMEAGDYCHYQYYNGTSYTTLLSLSGNSGLTLYSYNVSNYGLATNARIYLYPDAHNGAGDFCYIDSISITGSIGTQNVTNLNAIDSKYVLVQEAQLGGVSRIDATFNFENVTTCAGISPLLLTSLVVYANGKFDSIVNDDIAISIWNYTSSSWKTLYNPLHEGATFNGASNSIQLTNITVAGLYSPATGIKIRLTDSNYTDTINNILYLDQLYVGCEKLNGATWQEVKGSSEIHISNPTFFEGKFYIETLCGRDTETSSTSSACAEIRNDLNYWNYTWGYIFENITVLNSYEMDIEDTFTYETGLGQDCTAIIDIIKETSTSTESILDDVKLAGGDKENCKINIPISFISTDREFNIVITEDNYMRWEVQRNKDYLNYINKALSPFCQSVADWNGNPYDIPIDINEKNISEIYKDNELYLACYRAMDDIYWTDFYYNASLEIFTAGEYESYLLENRYYYPELKSFYNILPELQQMIFIGGTEYNQNETGIIAVRLVKSNGDAETGAVCNTTILYPTLTAFVNNSAMTELGQGVYSYTFVTPEIDGVYIYYADCSYAGRKYKAMDTFHVSNVSVSMEQADMTNYTLIYEGVWNYINRNLTYYQTQSINKSELAEAVWQYINRNLTYYPAQVDMTNYTKIQEDVWNYISRNLTYYQEFPTNISLIADMVWNYTDRQLTYYPSFPAQIDMTDYLRIQEMVWNNTIRELTFYPIINLTELGLYVWNSSIRDLTYYPPQVDLTNYSRIQAEVWENINRTLTFYPELNINITQIAEAVWAFNDRQLTYFPMAYINNTELIEGVWNYTARLLTYYPAQVDMTNYSRINDEVWAYVNRTLTYYPEINISQISKEVWEYTDRILTFYPDINNSMIAEFVWNFTDRQLTFFPVMQVNNSEIAEFVWNYTDRLLTQCPCSSGEIAEAVWNYTSRMLTFYPEINSTELAEYVWNYTERILTNQTDMTNYTMIYEGVWNYTNRTLTEYPELNVSQLIWDIWHFGNRTLTEYLIMNGTCDYSVPVIQSCTINDTFIGQGESVRLSCVVTDNMYVASVDGTVSLIIYSFTQNGNNWFKDFACDEFTTGTYNWTYVEAIDNVGLNASYSPMLSYTCDFTNYAPTAHIIDPSTDEIFMLPYNITFSTGDVNDDTLNVSLLLYIGGQYNDTIISDMDETDDFYYWNAVVAYGDYELVLKACELATTEHYCGNDTNAITIVECPASWIPQYGSCLSDDTKFKSYTDAHNCTNPYPSVPVDNGTYVPCNYCSQNLISVDSSCGNDDQINRTWVDLNFGTCCEVTNITADCSILSPPYNETTLIFCGETELMGLAECGLNPQFDLNEKEYCLINMPELPDNVTNETFDCITYVKAEDEVIQVNPEYKEKSGSVLGTQSEEETRAYFQEQNGLVNVYMTKKNLQPEINYTLGVQCSSPMRVVTSEVPITIDYENMEGVFSRGLWFRDNVGYIIAGSVLFILIGIVLLWLWKSAKN